MALNYGQTTEEYKRLVLDDLKNYEKLNHPRKTGLIQRLLVRKLPLSKLHPNPQDEFCDASIGPNYGIVADYEKNFRELMRMQMDPIGPYDEPLMVEKMSTGGYMILNGHHRWMAARRIGLKAIPVHIVNVSTDEEIISAVNSSSRNMCVSFDLDEVLLTDGSTYPVHKEFSFPFDRIYRKTLRRNASILIKELQAMGFDVWIYTGEYYPEAYLRLLFRLHGTKVDGIINGMRHRKTKSKIREAFSNKYRVSVHIDNENVTCVKTKKKEYEMFFIDSENQDWASEAISRLRESREYWA